MCKEKWSHIFKPLYNIKWYWHINGLILIPIRTFAFFVSKLRTINLQQKCYCPQTYNNDHKNFFHYNIEYNQLDKDHNL